MLSNFKKMESLRWSPRNLKTSDRSKFMIKDQESKRKSIKFIQLRTNREALCNFWKSEIQKFPRCWTWIEYLQQVDQQYGYFIYLGPMDGFLMRSEEN